MSGSSGRKKPTQYPKNSTGPVRIQPQSKPIEAVSMLDLMKDGREYESIVAQQPNGYKFHLHEDIKRSLDEISKIRRRPAICYIANTLNQNIKSSTSIDYNDETPFLEMLKNIPEEYKDIDIVLVTPGGISEVVARLVDIIRKRFETVGFILPFMAMSAGTIFCLSGDELIMSEGACIGPIDPQVLSRKAGRFVPAQAILTLISAIQERGEQQIAKGEKPLWTDIELIRSIDAKEIGSARAASQLSIDLVKKYLIEYKFRNWRKHESDSREVTDAERRECAEKIAEKLCDHSFWLSHAREITREQAKVDCGLKVVYPEDTEGLARAIRRFWALACFTFENTPISKLYASEWYTIFKQDAIVVNEGAKK